MYKLEPDYKKYSIIIMNVCTKKYCAKLHYNLFQVTVNIIMWELEKPANENNNVKEYCAEDS